MKGPPPEAADAETPCVAPLRAKPFLFVFAGTVAMLGVAIALWYAFQLHYGRRWLQPVFLVGGTLVYLALLRFAAGVRLRALSRRTWFTIASALGLLSVLWMFGRSGTFQTHLRDLVPASKLSPLYPWFYFSINCTLARTVAPLALVYLWFRQRPRDFGYGLRGTPGTLELALPWRPERTIRLRIWWIYAVLFLLVAAVVVLYASTLAPFQAKYPMSRAMIRGDAIAVEHFLLYQIFYGLVFFSGESFWRGYIIFGLERDLRAYGLVFMIIPYTMTHFGKPVPETVGAIATGMVLGWLALRHRSFWLGVATHWGVALVMDLSAVWRRGITIAF